MNAEPDPATLAQPLRAHAARGALLTVGAQIAKIGVQVLGVVVLARLLTPRDYGLVAMVLAVIGVAEVFRDFGLSSAAVQAVTLTPGQRSNLFWVNTAVGAVLAVAAVLCAPLLAGWYGRPELVEVTRALAVVFLVNGMTTQYRADLNRRLRFAPLAVADTIAPALALLVAIVLAAYGAGYWALVAQQVCAAAVLLLVTAGAGRWVPRRPDRSAPMRSLLSFGWQLTGSQLVGYAGNNIDAVVIGSRLGASPLGVYNRGFQLLMTPLGQLRAPTTTVALPVLSRLRDDPEASNRFVQRGQLAMGLTLVAGLGLVAGAAHPLTLVLLGQDWAEVTPVLRILAVAGACQTLAYCGYWVYLARQLTATLLRYTMLTTVLKIAAVLLGSRWGMVGVAAGYAAAAAVEWPLSLWWLSRRSPIRPGPLYRGAGIVVAVASVIAAASQLAVRWAGQWSAPAQLLAATLAAGGAYLVIGASIPPVRRALRDVVEILREGLARR